MKTMRVDEARESFSALVSAAERGEPTTILRDGRPAAVIVTAAEERRLYPLRAGRRFCSNILVWSLRISRRRCAMRLAGQTVSARMKS